MRPIRVRLSATGYTPWIQVDRIVPNFNIGLSVIISNGGSATYTVQHTFDDIHQFYPVNISRSTTTATATFQFDPAVIAGDSIFVIGTGIANFDGYQQVTGAAGNGVDYTVANSGATSSGSGQASIIRPFNHITLVSQTANADGNYISPISAIRLSATIVSGVVDLLILQGVDG